MIQPINNTSLTPRFQRLFSKFSKPIFQGPSKYEMKVLKIIYRKHMNAPCLQSKDVNWIEVRPYFHRRNLSFCLGLHNCRPFCFFFNTTYRGRAPRMPSRAIFSSIFQTHFYWSNHQLMQNGTKLIKSFNKQKIKQN